MCPTFMRSGPHERNFNSNAKEKNRGGDNNDNVDETIQGYWKGSLGHGFSSAIVWRWMDWTVLHSVMSNSLSPPLFSRYHSISLSIFNLNSRSRFSKWRICPLFFREFLLPRYYYYYYYLFFRNLTDKPIGPLRLLQYHLFHLQLHQ